MSNQPSVGFIEISQDENEITLRQRWSHILVLILSVIGFVIGINLKNSVVNATTFYTDAQAGITSEYPENWLIDTEGDYVFRVRDVTQPGFKTTIQVAVRPVSDETQARNILDTLSLDRSQSLATYSILAREPFVLPGDVEALSMKYTFVSAETNPFLQSTPQVVTGLDILTIKRGQAIIITFLSETTTFEENFALFEQFLNKLEF